MCTDEARQVVTCRIGECYRYGVNTLDVVYGTPDAIEGSIEQAVDELINANDLVERAFPIHAGIHISIKSNPAAEPQNSDMVFTAFRGSYESAFPELPHHRDYYPLRTWYNTTAVAKACECDENYVRKIVKELGDEFTVLVSERDDYTGRDVTRWQITAAGRERVMARWQQDRRLLEAELRKLGAKEDETVAILQGVRTPLSEGTAARRAKALLTSHRRATS